MVEYSHNFKLIYKRDLSDLKFLSYDDFFKQAKKDGLTFTDKELTRPDFNDLK